MSVKTCACPLGRQFLDNAGQFKAMKLSKEGGGEERGEGKGGVGWDGMGWEGRGGGVVEYGRRVVTASSGSPSHVTL